MIGLSAALELARNGFRVRVIEKGRAMSEASWAAAGMLSANDPDHPAELAQLAALSIVFTRNISARLSGFPAACTLAHPATLVTSLIRGEFTPTRPRLP